MDVHPKYIKFEKIGVFRRLINAGRAFVEGIINSHGHLINAPLNALEAFSEQEVEVVDRKMMLRDAQNESNDDDDNTITFKMQEEVEPWEKKHREIYKEDDD